MRQFQRYRVLLAAAALLLAACSEDEAGQPTEAPPPEVEVMAVEPQPVDNIVELPGRVQAVRVAEIRARVNGIIQRRLYEEGTDVEAGAALFQIDPREMQASLNSSKAALQRAEATAKNAAQDVRRYKGLVAKQAISQQEYDSAQARLRTAQADVSQAQAAVESAELNLEYTRVESPIEGRAGRAAVTEGALVSASEGTLLTTVEQFDPVYVNFSQSSSDLLAIRAQIASGALELPERGQVAVHLFLEDGTEYPQVGYIDFFAMTIDVSTGTVALRAEVPNPDRLLLPGQFVQARIKAGTRPDAFVIPQRAVVLTDSGATVKLVNDDGMVSTRAIEPGQLQGSNWLIHSGLKAGDRIIVEGGQNARNGQAVRAVDARSESAPKDDAPNGPAEQ